MINIEGTAYEMIAKALRLVQDGNAWADPNGNRFVLTKYGFQHAELMPAEDVVKGIQKKNAEAITILEKALAKRNKTIDDLYNQVEKLQGYSSRRQIRINTVNNK